MKKEVKEFWLEDGNLHVIGKDNDFYIYEDVWLEDTSLPEDDSVVLSESITFE